MLVCAVLCIFVQRNVLCLCPLSCLLVPTVTCFVKCACVHCNLLACTVMCAYER